MKSYREARSGATGAGRQYQVIKVPIKTLCEQLLGGAYVSPQTAHIRAAKRDMKYALSLSLQLCHASAQCIFLGGSLSRKVADLRATQCIKEKIATLVRFDKRVRRGPQKQHTLLAYTLISAGGQDDASRGRATPQILRHNSVICVDGPTEKRTESVPNDLAANAVARQWLLCTAPLVTITSAREFSASAMRKSSLRA